MLYFPDMKKKREKQFFPRDKKSPQRSEMRDITNTSPLHLLFIPGFPNPSHPFHSIQRRKKKRVKPATPFLVFVCMAAPRIPARFFVSSRFGVGRVFDRLWGGRRDRCAVFRKTPLCWSRGVVVSSVGPVSVAHGEGVPRRGISRPHATPHPRLPTPLPSLLLLTPLSKQPEQPPLTILLRTPLPRNLVRLDSLLPLPHKLKVPRPLPQQLLRPPPPSPP